MKIIGISGRKQSGKNTIANYINGDILNQRKMIKGFYINDHGKLIVNTQNSDGQDGYGEFDVTRKDIDFVEYAEINLWPYIKVYHFADPLKEMAINLFGLKAEEVYGSDEEKNKSTNLLWENMPNNQGKFGKITNREFLEHFGTNIVRKIRYDAWSEYTTNIISKQQPEIAIIPDVRFPNEVDSIKKIGGTVIRLTRNIFDSKAEAEVALDKENFDWNKFDLIIDNSNFTLSELCDHMSENKNLWRN